MDLSLPAYEIFLFSDLTYRFTTKSGDVYECSFISFADYFSAYPEIADHVFSFDLAKVSETPPSKGTDDRIGITVIKIIAAFLASVVDAVVYICDPSDGLDAVRFRKFKRWYSQGGPTLNRVVQVAREVDAGGMILYTALLVHEDNPLKDRFVQAYIELVTKNP